MKKKTEAEDMNDDKRTVQMPHNLTLNDRRKLSLTGVEEVIGCDEEVLTVKTVMGEMIVSGSMLHIGSFNRSTGELKIDGQIKELIYADAQPKQRGFFSRIFK